MPEAQTVSSRTLKAGVKLGFELLTFEAVVFLTFSRGQGKSSLFMSI